MTLRSLLVGTAAVLLLLGVTALFLPHVVISALSLGPGAEIPVQLFGGGLFSVAALNWMGRGAIYGGIYGRPIVIANFGLGITSASTLMSASLDGRTGSAGWVGAALFAVQAAGFFWVMRRSPWQLAGSAADTSEEQGA
jgi:hypothetical protein